MIKAAIFKDGFVITGHAGYAESGQDIVCAGVSALAQATRFTLNRFNNIVSDAREGNMSVHITNPNEDSHIIMEVLENGLYNISKEFPNHLSLKIERTNANGKS